MCSQALLAHSTVIQADLGSGFIKASEAIGCDICCRTPWTVGHMTLATQSFLNTMKDMTPLYLPRSKLCH